MENQDILNYNRIAQAIDYIKQNFKEQPNLDEIAEEVNLSPHHFQRLFTDWAGVSPKKFLQYISLNHAKNILKSEKTTLFEASYETGFSSTSRLHDLFISIEGMTPAEYKNGGVNLLINYSFAETKFGEIIIASTQKGICYLAFINNSVESFNELKSTFPNASYYQKTDDLHQKALSIFNQNWDKISKIKLHLKGTEFQLKVWEALLKIPLGKLSTYGTLAEKVENPTAARAVGTAIGSNPVALLIPCHRVIQSNGNTGGYMWGNTRKKAIIGWEQAKTYLE